MGGEDANRVPFTNRPPCGGGLEEPGHGSLLKEFIGFGEAAFVPALCLRWAQRRSGRGVGGPEKPRALSPDLV